MIICIATQVSTATVLLNAFRFSDVASGAVIRLRDRSLKRYCGDCIVPARVASLFTTVCSQMSSARRRIWKLWYRRGDWTHRLTVGALHPTTSAERTCQKVALNKNAFPSSGCLFCLISVVVHSGLSIR